MKSVIVLCFYFSKVHTVTLLKQKKYHVLFFLKLRFFCILFPVLYLLQQRGA